MLSGPQSSCSLISGDLTRQTCLSYWTSPHIQPCPPSLPPIVSRDAVTAHISQNQGIHQRSTVISIIGGVFLQLSAALSKCRRSERAGGNWPTGDRSRSKYPEDAAPGGLPRWRMSCKWHDVTSQRVGVKYRLLKVKRSLR